ncbi:hypothetical protein [Sinisalibacter aestuarii]|uniref:Uncharacterized protein n=1 Tax=Sinisalibacter aestuarii TaxID=2949426 RepID=A0ABQ5LQI5_9RHOB|nr:hypothetical protein [Sinisalibacter aestuarii]GKY86665.1 hypothetical protein STA1M1_05340 [Sinisalibacter aestuarii]
MNGIAFWFVAVAALCVTIGMGWGIQMSASGNHLLAGAHAHLNLVGWATMGLFGLYYHAVPAAAARSLAKVHFIVALAGVVLMVPGIALAITERGEMLAVTGSLLTFASMLIFLFTVATNRTA